jgi:hypothetical protein
MPDTTYTLLIWEEIPENTRLVVIPNNTLDESDLKVLTKAHGKYINNEDDPESYKALNCINNALCQNAEHLDKEHPVGSKWAQRWKDHYSREGEFPPVLDKIITRVYLCGFIL